MNASDYQKFAARTLIEEPDFTISGRDMMIIWSTIGLSGEAGEVAEHVKKGIFHQHGLDIAKLRQELGDVLWYTFAIGTSLGFDMGEVMQENIDKLKVRYPNGYNASDSQSRVDVKDQNA